MRQDIWATVGSLVSMSGLGATSGHATAPEIEPPKTPNLRKQINSDTIRSRLQIEQEITEKTEARSNLCSLRCLLFKSPSVARSCRTPRMSERRRQTLRVSLADWLSKTERLAAVSSIRFVRRHYSGLVTFAFNSPIGDFSSGHILTTLNIHLSSGSVEENGINVTLGERRNPMILSSKTCLRYRSSAVHAG